MDKNNRDQYHKYYQIHIKRSLIFMDTGKVINKISNRLGRALQENWE